MSFRDPARRRAALIAVPVALLLLAGALYAAFGRGPTAPESVVADPLQEQLQEAGPTDEPVAPSPSATGSSPAEPRPTTSRPAKPRKPGDRSGSGRVAAGTRVLSSWPFARDSIWNTPIGSGATYVPAGLAPANAWRGDITIDPEFISIDPSFPVKRLQPGNIPVHVDPSMSHNGTWNGCATFLRADMPGMVISGQPLKLDRGGNPSWQWTIGAAIELDGDGIEGCHGGSHMSGIGGSIRKGEMKSSAPLRHALKINLFCERFCSFSDGGKRWPALSADSYASPQKYGGKVTAVKMGTLLAVPPGVDLSFLRSPGARKIATALRDYGGYVVDDTAWDVHALSVEKDADFSDGGTFHADLMKVFSMLHAVDNNAPGRVGGGGSARAPLAPPFR